MAATGENSVDTKEAAEILGCTQQYLRIALQQGLFPFGIAIKSSTEYTYYINRNRLIAYNNADDLKGGGQA